MICTAKELLKIAEGELGYCGKKSNTDLYDKTANTLGTYNKYAADLWMNGSPEHYYNGNKTPYDFCCCFTDWCIWIACGKVKADALKVKPTNDCGAGVYWARLAMQKQMVNDPQPGDIFFHKDDSHTGFVKDVKDGTFLTIEGNWGKKVVSREGLKVSDFLFARPNYKPEPIIVPVSSHLQPTVPDCDDDCSDWVTVFENEHLRIQTK